MDNLKNSLVLLQPTGADAKLYGWYVLGGNVVIETVAQYLVRVPIKQRSPNAIVTMQLPKAGYASLGTYTVSEFKGGILANFEGHYYTFIGGLADANFVEIPPPHPPVSIHPESIGQAEIGTDQKLKIFNPDIAEHLDDLTEYLENSITSFTSYLVNIIASFTETDPIFTAHTVKNILNGTGFLKNNGSGVWSWDNSTYLTAITKAMIEAVLIGQISTHTHAASHPPVSISEESIGQAEIGADQKLKIFNPDIAEHLDDLIEYLENSITSLTSYLDNNIDSLFETSHPPVAISDESIGLAEIGTDQKLKILSNPELKDGIIDGGVVSWIEGYTYLISAATYRYLGVVSTAPGITVTLAASNITNPRIDVIALTFGVGFEVIAGVPAVNPAKPQIDETTQVERTSILVPANSTAPTGMTDALVFDENVEWNHSESGVVVNYNSAIAPFHGSKCIDVGTIAGGNTINFTAGAPLNVADFDMLSFLIKLKALTYNRDSLYIQFILNGSPISNKVRARWTQNNTTSWQSIVMLLTDFAFTAATFNGIRLRWTVIMSPPPTHPGFYLDYIKLQKGIELPIFNDTIEFTGDVIAKGRLGSKIPARLKTVNSNVGTFGSTTKVPRVTVNAKGLVTGVTEETIVSAQVQSDWNQANNTLLDFIKNKPTIPSAQVKSDWNAITGIAEILNKPTIPAAQVQSDWNAVSGMGAILNKPAASWAGLPDYQEFEFQNVVAGAQSWDLHIKATFGYTIESISLETDTGTITGVAVKINATIVTGLSAITVDTAVDTTVSTALKTVVAGDRITLSKTGETGLPTTIKGQINYIRT